jgi:hypothetical protein
VYPAPELPVIRETFDRAPRYEEGGCPESRSRREEAVGVGGRGGRSMIIIGFISGSGV